MQNNTIDETNAILEDNTKGIKLYNQMTLNELLSKQSKIDHYLIKHIDDSKDRTEFQIIRKRKQIEEENCGLFKTLESLKYLPEFDDSVNYDKLLVKNCDFGHLLIEIEIPIVLQLNSVTGQIGKYIVHTIYQDLGEDENTGSIQRKISFQLISVLLRRNKAALVKHSGKITLNNIELWDNYSVVETRLSNNTNLMNIAIKR